LRQRACNLTPLDARVSLPKPRVQLDPAPPEPHLPLVHSGQSGQPAQPVDQSINQSINPPLSLPQPPFEPCGFVAAPTPSPTPPPTPPPPCHCTTRNSLGKNHLELHPNWYHVDGNLAAKTRSNHPNGVVGV
jgi:hypothetical protein